MSNEWRLVASTIRRTVEARPWPAEAVARALAVELAWAVARHGGTIESRVALFDELHATLRPLVASVAQTEDMLRAVTADAPAAGAPR